MKWYKSSLFNKIIVILAVSLVVLFAVQKYTVSKLSEVIQKNFISSNTNIATSMKDNVNTYFKEIQRVMVFLSKLDEVKALDLKMADKYLKEIASLNPFIEQLYIMDTKGQQIYKTSYLDTMGDRSDREYFQVAIKGEYYISDSLISRSTNKPIIVVALPIYNADKIVGVLGASVDLEYLSTRITGIKIQEDGYGYMVDSDGVLIAYPNFDSVTEQLNLSYLSVVSEVMRGINGSGVYTFDNTEKMAAFIPVGINNWGLIVQVPIVEMYEEVESKTILVSYSYFAVFFILLVLIILSFYFSFMPIENILRGVNTLNFASEALPFGRIENNEYGIIKLAINDMKIRLYDMYKNLEQIVDKRTSDLSDANNELEKKINEVNHSRLELEETNEELNAALNNLESTQQKLLELEKINALGRFGIRLAHELNTPLGILVSNSSFLKLKNEYILTGLIEGNLKKEILFEYLNQSKDVMDGFEKQIGRIIAITDSFKELIVDDKASIKEVVDIEKLLNKIESWFKLECSYKNCELDLDICQAVFLSYPNILEKIIKQFIKNSTEHGFIEGKKLNISIVIKKIDSSLKIILKDDGKGIERELLANIFEPLSKTQMSSGGSGLGLSYVYSIVTTLLEGEVSLTSEIGKGLNMEIIIPIDEESVQKKI